MSINYYVFVGPHKHWSYGLEQKVWGIRPEAKPQVKWWKGMKKGDKAILYVTGTSTIIGTAEIVGTREKKMRHGGKKRRKVAISLDT